MAENGLKDSVDFFMLDELEIDDLIQLWSDDGRTTLHIIRAYSNGAMPVGVIEDENNGGAFHIVQLIGWERAFDSSEVNWAPFYAHALYPGQGYLVCRFSSGKFERIFCSKCVITRGNEVIFSRGREETTQS